MFYVLLPKFELGLSTTTDHPRRGHHVIILMLTTDTEQVTLDGYKPFVVEHVAGVGLTKQGLTDAVSVDALNAKTRLHFEMANSYLDSR
eukprot:scaffold1992_cov187-Amphora_coffeaeformis.AAC.15